MEEALKMIEENDSDALSSIPHLTVSEEDLRDTMELEIPSIDLNEKVLPVTTKENLSIALTQIKSHQMPGKEISRLQAIEGIEATGFSDSRQRCLKEKKSSYIIKQKHTNTKLSAQLR